MAWGYFMLRIAALNALKKAPLKWLAQKIAAIREDDFSCWIDSNFKKYSAEALI